MNVVLISSRRARPGAWGSERLRPPNAPAHAPTRCAPPRRRGGARVGALPNDPPQEESGPPALAEDSGEGEGGEPDQPPGGGRAMGAAPETAADLARVAMHPPPHPAEPAHGEQQDARLQHLL